jgi:hypothetical protein
MLYSTWNVDASQILSRQELGWVKAVGANSPQLPSSTSPRCDSKKNRVRDLFRRRAPDH